MNMVVLCTLVLHNSRAVHKYVAFIINERMENVYEMKQRTENQILELAIDAFNRETGVPVDIVTLQPKMGDRQYDAIVNIDGHELMAEVKNHAQHGNLGAIIAQIQNMPRRGLLVADYVNPNMANVLRQQKIQFIANSSVYDRYCIPQYNYRLFF